MELSVAFLDCSPRHLHISKPLLTKRSHQWTLIMVIIICSRMRPAEAVPTDLGWAPPDVQDIISLPLAPAGSVWPWPSSGPTLCCGAPGNYCLGLCPSERLQKCLSQAAEMAFFFLQCEGEVVGLPEGMGLAGGVGRLRRAISMVFLAHTDLWKEISLSCLLQKSGTN